MCSVVCDITTRASAGQWHDLVITQRDERDGSVSVQQSGGVFVSNYIPLWVGLAPPNSQEALAALYAFKASVSLLECLERSVAGLPLSMIATTSTGEKMHGCHAEFYLPYIRNAHGGLLRRGSWVWPVFPRLGQRLDSSGITPMRGHPYRTSLSSHSKNAAVSDSFSQL